MHVRSPSLYSKPRILMGTASGAGLLALAIAIAEPASASLAQQKPSAAEFEHAGSGYDALIKEALAEFDAGNFAEARALFEKAHGLKPSARTLRALAMTSFELKRYVRCVMELEASLQDGRQALAEAQRDQAHELLVKARRYVGKVKLVVKPSKARIFVDDRLVESPELLLDLGSYRVSVRAKGYRDADLKLVVDGGEDTTQTIELAPTAARAEGAVTSTATAPVLTVSDAGAREQASSRAAPLHRQWWFWTGLATVAVGSAVALAIAFGDPRDPPYRGSAGSFDAP